jgi:hypothetical protein
MLNSLPDHDRVSLGGPTLHSYFDLRPRVEFDIVIKETPDSWLLQLCQLCIFSVYPARKKYSELFKVMHFCLVT